MYHGLFERIRLKVFPPRASKLSYSQSGEDLILETVFSILQKPIRQVRYLDVGANDPVALSNTYRLYLLGAQGVCVEPNPELADRIRKKRPRDVCLNVGVGLGTAADAEFFLMHPHTLSTFVAADAERLSRSPNHQLHRVVKIPLQPIQAIFEQHFSPAPDLVSLDSEGLDFDILQSIDFDRYRPSVFCVETLTYSPEGDGQRMQSILDFLHERDYFTVADTYINSIFVDREVWNSRGENRRAA